MKRREFLLACSGLAITPLVLTLGGCASRTAQPGAASRSPAGNHVIRYSFTIDNASGEILAGQRLWFYGPVRKSGSQDLRRLETSLASSSTQDALGNNVVRVDLPAMPPYATRMLTVDVELEMEDRPRGESLTDTKRFLAAEPFIETESPEIAALAGQLKRGNSVETARAIYDWVRDNIRYSGFRAEDVGALGALNSRQGDCTEYTYLVCALARANGIPARALGGYVVGQNTTLRPEDYHNWAQLHFDGRWNLVDAQKGSFMPERNSYAIFEIIAADNRNALQGAHRYRVEGSVKVTMG